MLRLHLSRSVHFGRGFNTGVASVAVGFALTGCGVHAVALAEAFGSTPKSQTNMLIVLGSSISTNAYSPGVSGRSGVSFTHSPPLTLSACVGTISSWLLTLPNKEIFTLLTTREVFLGWTRTILKRSARFNSGDA